MDIDINHKDCLKIIQITDTHLFSKNTDLFGVDTNKNFDKIMEFILQEELNDTDFFLLTGDLSQDETPESYQYLLDAFKNIRKPIFWIPGNHDDIDVMSEIFSQFSLFNWPDYIELKHWIFVFINTKKEGSINGYITPDALKNIKAKLELASEKKKKMAIIMHHHPKPVNTPLIDQYILDTQDELWDLISDSNVKLIITGHVHGDYSFVHNNINIECAPATCFQFSKGSQTLQIEKLIGYKVHYFNLGEYFSKPILRSI